MNFELVKELYLQGKTLEEIHKAVGGRLDNLMMSVNEIKRTYSANGVDYKLKQIKAIETELFEIIEKEQKTGKKYSATDSLLQTYKTYLVI